MAERHNRMNMGGLAVSETIEQATQILALGFGAVRILGALADVVEDLTRANRIGLGWDVGLAGPSTGARNLSPQRIAPAALPLLRAAFAPAFAHFSAERLRAFAQVFQRRALRGLGVFKIAAAQRVFRLAHGISSSVQLFARRCAGFLGHALSFRQALANLRLAFGEFSAALAALLFTAAALAGLVPLTCFVIERALFAHRF